MAIIITSTVEGFRRAGVAHSTEPTTWPDDAFDEAQLAQLQAERHLKVEIVKGGAAAPADPPPPGPNEWAQVGAAIRELEAEDYTAGGKPEVDAIVRALGEDGPKVTARIRDQVWDELVKAGFKAPEKAKED